MQSLNQDQSNINKYIKLNQTNVNTVGVLGAYELPLKSELVGVFN